MINVLFFGQLKEQLGVAGIQVSIETDVTVSKLLDTILKTYPHWAQDINSKTVLVAVDQVMAKADTRVSVSCEVAFFRPVTGG